MLPVISAVLCPNRFTRLRHNCYMVTKTKYSKMGDALRSCQEQLVHFLMNGPPIRTGRYILCQTDFSVSLIHAFE